MRKLVAAAGDRFACGVVLYDGEVSAGFGDRLHAVPIRRLWKILDRLVPDLGLRAEHRPEPGRINSNELALELPQTSIRGQAQVYRPRYAQRAPGSV